MTPMQLMTHKQILVCQQTWFNLTRFFSKRAYERDVKHDDMLEGTCESEPDHPVATTENTGVTNEDTVVESTFKIRAVGGGSAIYEYAKIFDEILDDDATTFNKSDDPVVTKEDINETNEYTAVESTVLIQLMTIAQNLLTTP